MSEINTEAITLALDMVERWCGTARAEVDDIGGWRDADAGDRSAVYWAGAARCPQAVPALCEWFYSDTAYLVGWIAAHCPTLDPAPLQEIYAAASAWHEDHNASRIPAQPVVCATLERALMVVGAVEADLRARLTPAPDSWVTATTQQCAKDFDISENMWRHWAAGKGSPAPGLRVEKLPGRGWWRYSKPD